MTRSTMEVIEYVQVSLALSPSNCDSLFFSLGDAASHVLVQVLVNRWDIRRQVLHVQYLTHVPVHLMPIRNRTPDFNARHIMLALQFGQMLE